MSVELICDPVMDGEKPPFATEWPPSPLKNHGHNSAYCCQVGRPNKEGGRVQLKTGLKLWENILQTVRRIDFQIIEVKGIAVIFIYSKSSSLNFQLLVEVVIKNGYGDICMTSTYQFVFSVYLFFYDSLFLSEYLVMGFSTPCGSGDKKWLWGYLHDKHLSICFFGLFIFLWFLILVRVSGHGNKAIQFGRGNQVFVVQSQARKSNFCLRGC